MKTIIFLALLSLSFAFIPKSLFRENLTVSDVVTGETFDSAKDTNSSDSSDYLVIEIYPDYSDWNNITNSTDSSDYLAVEIYPGDNDWNNASLYNRDNLTVSDEIKNMNSSNSSDYLVIETYYFDGSNWYNVTNPTNSTDSSDYLFTEIYFGNGNWTNITNSSDSSDYLVGNISHDNSDWDNLTFYEKYNLTAKVIAEIALNATKYMNSSNSSDYLFMEISLGDNNWTNITNSSDFSDYPVIEIDTDDSDWISIQPEIIELFKPIFMNFTEAYYQYLSDNNSEVSLEDQLLYDDILTSIAQLFNETIEEKALFGNVTEKDNITERNNTENQDGKNFIGSQ